MEPPIPKQDLDKSIRQANAFLNSTICSETHLEAETTLPDVEIKEQDITIKFDPLVVANGGSSNYKFRNIFFSERPYSDPIEFMKAYFLRNRKLILRLNIFNFLFVTISTLDGVIFRLPFLWGFPALICIFSFLYSIFSLKWFKFSTELLEDDCVEVTQDGDSLIPRTDDLNLYLGKVINLNAFMILTLVSVSFDLMLVFLAQLGILQEKLTLVMFKEKSKDLKEKTGLINFLLIFGFNLLWLYFLVSVRLYFRMKPSCTLALRDIEEKLEKSLKRGRN